MKPRLLGMLRKDSTPEDLELMLQLRALWTEDRIFFFWLPSSALCFLESQECLHSSNELAQVSASPVASDTFITKKGHVGRLATLCFCITEPPKHWLEADNKGSVCLTQGTWEMNKLLSSMNPL